MVPYYVIKKIFFVVFPYYYVCDFLFIIIINNSYFNTK